MPRALVLRSESALGSHVDDEKHLALISAQRSVLVVDVFDGDLVNRLRVSGHGLYQQ